jgi:hypothetical protein
VATRPRRPASPPPSPAELAPLFPELGIEGLLGAGGMGAVYRATQKRLGRAVALKVLHAELSGDPVFVERFLREAQAMAKLAHPGIVAVHDYGEREGRCYLVMEHVEGANLRALLRQGLLAPRQALDIVRQLCDALQFAHDEGVVHRDIKPENVLVDAKGRVKVADFGLAKLVGTPASITLTDAGAVMGTPHYMAPEQVERPRDVDHRADLFSLGVVFYEMLTGELPLGRFAPPSQRVEIDVRLDEIVLKTLERERERRYQQAAEVRTAVERVEREPAKEERARAEGSRASELRSGVYLPRLRGAFGSHRPSAWSWLAFHGLAWALLGVTFGLGPWWLALLGVPLLAWVFLSTVMERAGTEPEIEEELGPWVARLGPGAFALAVAGVAALLVAHVAGFERWTWDYVASDQRPMAGLERLRGAEPELLRRVGISLEGSGRGAGDLGLEFVSSHSLSNPYALLGLHPLLLGSAGLVLLAGAALAAARARQRPAREWRLAVMASLAILAAPLAAWHFLGLVVRGGEQRLEAVQASRECGGEAETLAAALYAGLLERGLEVHAQHRARIVDRRSGEGLADVHALAAGPASVFERWRVTWRGPLRLEPHVNFTVVSDARGERAALRADGGLGARERLAESDWAQGLGELLRLACEGSR